MKHAYKGCTVNETHQANKHKSGPPFIHGWYQTKACLISQQTSREESDAGLEHSRISARANESGSVYKRNKGLPQRATVCANSAQRREKGATGGMIDNNCDNWNNSKPLCCVINDRVLERERWREVKWWRWIASHWIVSIAYDGRTWH